MSSNQITLDAQDTRSTRVRNFFAFVNRRDAPRTDRILYPLLARLPTLLFDVSRYHPHQLIYRHSGGGNAITQTKTFDKGRVVRTGKIFVGDELWGGVDDDARARFSIIRDVCQPCIIIRSRAHAECGREEYVRIYSECFI